MSTLSVHNLVLMIVSYNYSWLSNHGTNAPSGAEEWCIICQNIQYTSDKGFHSITLLLNISVKH